MRGGALPAGSCHASSVAPSPAPPPLLLLRLLLRLRGSCCGLDHAVVIAVRVLSCQSCIRVTIAAVCTAVLVAAAAAVRAALVAAGARPPTAAPPAPPAPAPTAGSASSAAASAARRAAARQLPPRCMHRLKVKLHESVGESGAPPRQRQRQRRREQGNQRLIPGAIDTTSTHAAAAATDGASRPAGKERARPVCSTPALGWPPACLRSSAGTVNGRAASAAGDCRASQRSGEWRSHKSVGGMTGGWQGG